MLGHRAYAPYDAYAARAAESAELPRLIFGVLLIESIYVTSLNLLDAALSPLPLDWTDGYYYGTTRLGLIAQLFSFVLLAGAVILTAQLLHKRGPLSLLGSAAGLRHLPKVTLAVLVLFLGVELLPPYWNFDSAEMNEPATWLAILPVALAALLVQTGAEEIFYRGYVQQQLAARFRSPWIWLTGPNLLFAYAHWDDSVPLADGVQYVVWAFLFGVAASDLTARTGSLGAAVGFHLANNIYAFLFFGEYGLEDSGLALLMFPPEDIDTTTPITNMPPEWITPAFVVELGLILLMWLVARLVLRR